MRLKAIIFLIYLEKLELKSQNKILWISYFIVHLILPNLSAKIFLNLQVVSFLVAFSQFIESYLLKKIHLKSVGGKASDSMNDLGDIHMHHDASFDSQGSNDSAKRIRLKIEDSKKLLDMASNIKGLNLDPEKKREFMKLLIDFDQKYGDHDLVDALEKDITDNIAEEATVTQSLVDTIKAKMDLGIQSNEKASVNYTNKFEKTNSILPNLLDNPDNLENSPTQGNYLEGAEIVEGSSKSSLLKKRDSSRTKRDKHITISQADVENKNNSSQIRSLDRTRSKDLNDSAEALNVESANSLDKNTSLKKLSSKKFDLKEFKYNEVNEDQNDKESVDGQKSKKSLELKENHDIRVAMEEEDNNISNKIENRENSRNSRKNKDLQERDGRISKVGEAENQTLQNNDKVLINNKMSNKSKRRRIKRKSNGADETFISLRESNDEEESFEDSDLSNNDLIDEKNQLGERKKVPGLRMSTNIKKNKDGKILFTNRRTQEILENLAEEQARHSSRSQSKNRTGRRGSMKGEEFVEVDDNGIIYQEIVMENGEIKLVPIGNASTHSNRDGTFTNYNLKLF